MKKKKPRPSPFRSPSWLPNPDLIWGGLALSAWALEQYLHALKGTPFSFLIFAKGAGLLAGAAFLYQLFPRKGISFLGLFPLLWLAVSRFQWELCSAPAQRFWIWLVLFLLCGIFMIRFPDGKKLLALLPLWALLVWLFKFSLLLPLVFFRLPAAWTEPLKKVKGWILSEEHLLVESWGKGWMAWVRWLGWVYAGWLLPMVSSFLLVWFFPASSVPMAFLVAAPSAKFKRSVWITWGGLLTFLALFLVFRGWNGFEMNWDFVFNFFFADRYLAFFLLGWLGLAVSPNEGTFRYSIFSLFLLVPGLLFWPENFSPDLLGWVLVFFAGFGWEAVRRDLLDPSWHARLAWTAMGVGLFGGVI